MGLSPQLGFPGFVGGLLVVVGTAGLLVVLVVIGGGMGRVVIGGGTTRVVVIGGTGGRMVVVGLREVVGGTGIVGPVPGTAHLPAMQVQSASQSFSVTQGSPGEVLAFSRESSWIGDKWHTQAVAGPYATGNCRVRGTSGRLDGCGGLLGGCRLGWAPRVRTLVVFADQIAITVCVALAFVACWCQYKNSSRLSE